MSKTLLILYLSLPGYCCWHASGYVGYRVPERCDHSLLSRGIRRAGDGSYNWRVNTSYLTAGKFVTDVRQIHRQEPKSWLAVDSMVHDDHGRCHVRRRMPRNFRDP